MVLTPSGGDMYRGIISTLPAHHKLEKLGQISGRVPLEKVDELHDVVTLI